MPNRISQPVTFPEIAIAPAVVTYGSEYQIHLGGIEAQLLHFGNAYSNSDTVVYFPNLKVVAIGDLFSAKPAPDLAAGGSLVGWGAVLAQVLKLDFDVAIPSTGPTITRAELEAFKTKIDTLVVPCNRPGEAGCARGSVDGRA